MHDIIPLLLHYQRELQEKKIAKAYHFLLHFMMKIKADFALHHKREFNVGAISPGYLDFSYFPFFDASLRKNKLRYGLVLNHVEMRIELWLMGQNAQVQHAYWKKLRKSPWNIHRYSMPKYAILELVLVEDLTFDSMDELLLDIRTKILEAVSEIKPFL